MNKPEEINICPECKNGKHPNCDKIAWDDKTDEAVPCECFEANHKL